MRTIVLSLAVAAALGLAGCSGGSSGSQPGATGSAGNGSATPASASSSVSGTVGLRAASSSSSAAQPKPLSDQAVLTIKLVDVSSNGGKPLATKKISPIDNLPVDFKFHVKPDDIHPSDLYVVDATIVDGIRHYTMPLQAPVLTQKAPDHVDIHLVAQPTPGEEMYAAYKKLKAQIGGMKMSKDTSRTSKISRAWQVFRDKENGQIRFVIELVEPVKGNFTNTNFAYKDSKPWVVVREIKSDQKAKPSETDRAGWDSDGKLVLKQKIADGKTSTLSDDKAADLRKDAVSMFERARKTK
jgi:putative lipoprotein